MIRQGNWETGSTTSTENTAKKSRGLHWQQHEERASCTLYRWGIWPYPTNRMTVLNALIAFIRWSRICSTRAARMKFSGTCMMISPIASTRACIRREWTVSVNIYHPHIFKRRTNPMFMQHAAEFWSECHHAWMSIRFKRYSADGTDEYLSMQHKKCFHAWREKMTPFTCAYSISMKQDLLNMEGKKIYAGLTLTFAMTPLICAFNISIKPGLISGKSSTSPSFLSMRKYFTAHASAASRTSVYCRLGGIRPEKMHISEAK